MKTPDASQHAKLYTDFSEMHKLRQQAKDNDPAALQAVAEQFEQLFLNMLMKSMRQANEGFGEGNFFNSPQVKFYQDMADNQMMKELAENKGFGLAEVLVKQLGGNIDTRPGESDEEQPLKPLSESERMLSRAFDQAASVAASAVLGQAQAAAAKQEKAAQDDSAAAVPAATQPAAAPVIAVKASAEPALPERFESPEQFVQSLLPLAEKVAGELGVDPKVLLAQAALETGWGRYVIQRDGGGSSHNLFNIKADSRWDGDRAQVGTVEFRDGVAQKERAAFRVYDSYEQSFRDYADFLQKSTRYQGALSEAANPYRYLQSLQDAGYATDPEYAQKISRIFDGDVMATAASGRADNTKERG